MKRLIFTLGAAVLMALPMTADAQPWGGQGKGRGQRQGMHQRRQGGRRQMAARLLERLDLTAEQKDQMQTLRSSHQKQTIQLQADTKVAQLELRELIRKADGPTRAVNAKVAEVSKLQGQMLGQKVAHQLKRKSILTDEQRVKLQELRENPPQRGHRGGNPWRGRGQGQNHGWGEQGGRE